METENLCSNIRATAIQIKLKRYDRDYNLRTALEYIKKAADDGEDDGVPHVLCIPNYFLQTGTERIPGPATEAIALLCRKYGVYVIGGTAEDTGNNKGFNSAFLVSPDGSVKVIQRKLHMITMEKVKLTCGDKIELFEIAGIRMGCVMCNDIFYPEVARRLAVSGAEVLFIPAMIGGRGVKGMTAVARARAIENQVYVVNANGIPCEVAEMRPNFIMGGSAVYSPFLENTDLAGAGSEETTITSLLNLDRLREVKRTSELDAFDLCQLSEGKSFNMLQSRRPDIYGKDY